MNTRLTSMRRYIAKRAFIRKPFKLLFPDQIPFRHLGDSVPKGIFLTGIYRSGTSWISHIISQAEGISYWREPFNPSCGICKRQQYLYLTEKSDDQYYKMFTNKFFKGQFVGTIPDHVKTSQWYKILNSRTFIKDPTGAFLLDWMSYHY